MPNQGKERSKVAAPEMEQDPQVQFLNEIYDSITNWLTVNKNARIVAEIKPEYVAHWTSDQPLPGRVVKLGIHIEKGLLLTDSHNDYALVLGRRRRTSYDRKSTHGLQFGFIPKSKDAKRRLDSAETVTEEEKTEYARRLVNQSMFTYGSGELYVNDVINRLEIDIWTDHRAYGGNMVRDWPKDRLLSDEGKQACLNCVDRLVERAFLR